MRSLIVAVASALLLAVVVTEFVQRLWPSSYLALLIITAIALLINGIFNQRMAGKPAAAPAANPGNKANRNQRNDRNNETRKKPANNDRGNTRDNKSNATSAAPAASSVPSGPREHGEVKWFNRSKGFGFIIRESGDEIFVHQRSIRGADDARSRPVLRDGEAVEFVVTEHDKGLQAEDVVATDRN